MTDESFSQSEEESMSESSEEKPRRNKKKNIRKPPKKNTRKTVKRKLDDDMDEYGKNDPRKKDILKFFIINMNPETPPFLPKKKYQSPKEDLRDVREVGEVVDGFGPKIPSGKTNQTINFFKTFDSLKELIELGEKYDPSINYTCNIDLKKLRAMVEPLKELDCMIGLQKFKKSMVDQVVYLLTLDLENKGEKPMMHTCIYGPPGAGKSKISSILAKIYASCGFLSTDQFKIVKREDFVAGYLGQTAIKTKELLEKSLGKVLFLDEAYSMGSTENRDYFAKEAIDTLNVFLSENYSNFIMIIAGYEDELNKCFFAQNPGLSRRFPYRFTIEGYNYKELALIFQKFVADEGWTLEANNLENFFREHKDSFPYLGGDVKTLLDKCKIVQTKKWMILDKSRWKILTNEDIKDGFILYLEERQIKKKNDIPNHMYL